MTDLSGQYLGRYYLVERLGEGGMAIVYKAYDTRLERDVAIKIIRSGAFPSDDLEQILKRFEREAKSLAKLSHPNIVKVYDYGEHEDSPYLVMEYLPGGTLKKLIGKSVPWQEAVRLILPVARGIAYAHQSGILHRDIKPANILITASGDPMLSDFGIAKLFEGDQTTALTGSGMAIGTPEYMAPEQWAGTTSPQSDLYSLGIVLYEMVTGRKPYIADTPGAILIKQVTEPLPNPRKFVAEIPEALEHALVKALAREPADRYRDILAFIGALENLHVSTPAVLPTQETQEVEATYQVPAVKHEEPVPTEVVTRVGSETVQAVEPKKVEKLPPVKSRAAKTRHPVKFSRRGVGILIGGMVVIFALWLGSPWMGKLFTPASILTATSTPSVTPTKTLTPTPSLTPTETFTPTVAVTVTPYPTEISDIDPSGNSIFMRLVPAGKFMMGSEKLDNEKPIHEVFLDAYYIDVYEVTNILYKACVTAGVCDKPQNTGSTIRSSYYGNSKFDDYPIIYVTWDMAKTYCKWREARLPTEAQWEKAARGTDERTYPWGERIDCSKANYSGCVGDTTRVGNYEDGISPFGLYDMAGNVREWVSSAYKPYPYDATDGREDLTASRDLMLRGGSWGDLKNEVRSAIRVGIIPSYTNEGVGFRCARSVGTSVLQSTVTQISTPEPVTNVLPVQITDDKGVSMHLVPAGKFTMGSNADISLAKCKKFQSTNCQRNWFENEEPPHEVELSSFYIDTYEVTNILYNACLTAEVCDPPKNTDHFDNPEYENHPVVYVDWYMAKTYCEWRGAGLPTEAQWEKAARGTDGRTYPWGSELDCSKANYFDGVKQQGCANNTTPVGSYESGISPYGLYDMAGNVWEWVSDWYSDTYYANSPLSNPIGPESGLYRVLRGGGWEYSAHGVLSAARPGYDPAGSGYHIGFRCSRSLP